MAATMIRTSADMETLQRSKAACVRCRNRKTKCLGAKPCDACKANKVECIYPRKPKKIKIYDTELEALRAKIDELERKNDITKSSEVSLAPSKSETPFGISKALGADEVEEDMSLSILLRSPSCEVITWNLANFLNGSVARDSNLTITPEFSSFMEADCYDSIISRRGRKLKEFPCCYEVLKDITLDMVYGYVNTVAEYINVGYSTLDKEAFIDRLPTYFSAEGKLKPIPEKDQVDYFIIKILLIIALGLVYDCKNCIGAGNPRLSSVPGLVHFKLAVSSLPTNYQQFDFGMNNFGDNLQTIEILGLVALYSRILDKKNASCFFTMSALQLGVSMNLHKQSMITKSRSLNLGYSSTYNYNTKIFWAIYCLNRFYLGRIGQPLLLTYKDITLSQDHLDPGLRCYVQLARISEMINREIYNDSVLNSKNYFNTLFYILSLLKHWSNTLPSNLALELEQARTDVSRRLLASLHLNHLHHVYLTCIPIFLHFAKLKIIGFRKLGGANYFKLSSLPKNVQDLFHYCIKCCQLTVTIFVKLLERKLVRAFGFTELDYLYSCGLLFFICILLNFDSFPCNYNFNRNFEENLLTCLRLMKQMEVMGNMVAESKLKQILELMEKFKPILSKLDWQLKVDGETAWWEEVVTEYDDTPTDAKNVDVLLPSNEEFFTYVTDESLLNINAGDGLTSINQFANITDDDLNFMSQVLYEFDTDLLFN